MRYYCLFLLLILICCTHNEKGVTENNESSDTMVVETQQDQDQRTEVVEADSGTETDCIFNDDSKGLTTEWLTNLNKQNFVWNEDLEQALLTMGKDSVSISRGGCYHFGEMVSLKVSSKSHPVSDSTFWISKALELAKEFQMEVYVEMIELKMIRKTGDNVNSVWYEFDDPEENDNLIFNGIEINFEGEYPVLSMSQYYN